VPVETFNYLDSLNASNPVSSEGLVGGDDHIRGIKSTLLSTFPSVTGAVTATHTALNAAGVAATDGASLLDDDGVFFKTSGDGLVNALAGDIDVKLQGSVAATFQRTGGANFFKVFGGIEATGEIKGPGITPIGGTIIWWDDTLPADGKWAWANGQVITNANVSCPILLARWGNKFGGNGTTTMGVPNLQEVVPVGKQNMGGAASPFRITTILSAIMTAIGSVFGSQTHTLTALQLPAILSSGTMSGTSAGSISGTASNVLVGGSGTGVGGGGAFGVNGTAPVTGSYSGSASVSGVVQSTNTNNEAHNNLQPGMIVNWIIRIG
jgi:microcystin-dependent protein